jgi:hypothetical protein
MCRRFACCALVSVLGIALAGCGGSERTASTTTAKPTTTTSTTSTTTTTLSPKQTAANAYFGIVAVTNPASDRTNARYPTNLSWRMLPAYCADLEANDQDFINRMNAVTWPPEVQAQATDLIAKIAVAAGLEQQCATAAGTTSAQSELVTKRQKAYDDDDAAASALRAVLGLPVARS